jgi:lysylphosphatidylglycerol synthetase-like protein (DUF2156 family)
MADVLSLVIVGIIVVVILRGIFIVFTNNFWLAALMLILLFPLLVVWAFVEGLFNWR